MKTDSLLKWLPSLVVLSGLAALLTGCDAQEMQKPISMAVPNMDHLPLVDHPEYLNWSKFPIGTTIKRRNEIVNDNGVVVVLTTLKLIELSDKIAIVESQTTVEREGRIDEKPPQTFDYYAKFRLMEGLTIERYSLPAPNAKKTGSEEIDVAGVKMMTDVYECEGMLESGKIGIKLWRSDDFPGRVVRTETDFRDPTKSSSKEVTISLIRPDEFK